MDVKLIAAFAVLAGLVAIAPFIPTENTGATSPATLSDIQQFESEAAFQSYVQKTQGSGYNTLTGMRTDVVETTAEFQASRDTTQSGATAGGDGGAAPEEPSRYSETNVQVQGIDEPDIVKTDGQHIFYARQLWQSNTSIIDAWPPANMSQASSVKQTGNLLLQDDLLLVLSDDWQSGTLTAYDVSDAEQPEKEWSADLNGSITAARMYNGELYLVLQERVDYDHPCPVRPMTIGGDTITVPCTSIYHPRDPVNTDVTYTLMKMDPDNGDVSDHLTFVGDSRRSVVYMSENALYVTHTWEKNPADLYLSFFREEGGDLLDDNARQQLQRLDTYNISQQAKMVEVQHILSQYRQKLGKDERKTFDTEFRNALGNYTQDHMREFQHTGITKIGIGDGFNMEARGQVPGRPLNQFSLDEYDGSLRIATTVDPVRGLAQSENDVYVLDGNMETVGSVTGMGVNERVYSVRFIEDQGYVVTFRRVDPFHVLDLSDPENPELKGELKLPGFSSYLHPVKENRILGIGREDSNVKLVMFDVSNPENPTIADDYIIDEYWSAVENTHHAFLQDEKHGVFFVPTNDGGYVFSYENGLELEKAVDMERVERALFIDDYLYIIGQNEIVVLDESDWNRANTLELAKPNYPKLPHEPLVERGSTQ